MSSQKMFMASLICLVILILVALVPYGPAVLKLILTGIAIVFTLSFFIMAMLFYGTDGRVGLEAERAMSEKWLNDRGYRKLEPKEYTLRATADNQSNNDGYEFFLSACGHELTFFKASMDFEVHSEFALIKKSKFVIWQEKLTKSYSVYTSL